MTSTHAALRRWTLRAAALVPGYILAAYLGNWTVLLTIRLEAVAIFVITIVAAPRQRVRLRAAADHCVARQRSPRPHVASIPRVEVGQFRILATR